MCSYDICDLDLKYCYSDDLLYKRDEQETPDSQSSDVSDFSLAKRAGKERKTFKIGSAAIIYYIAGYPSIGKLFNPTKYGAALLTKAFRMRKGFCGGSTLDILNLPTNPTERERKNLETEHPLDKGLQGKFLGYMGNQQLPGDRSANFPKIDSGFWDKWDTPNAKLGAMPQFGKMRKGKQPIRPSEYLAEAFGSERNPEPFMAVEKGINTAKRDIFLGQAPVHSDRLKKAAESAVKQDTDEAANKMLSMLQVVSSYGFALDFTQADQGF